MSSAFKDEEGTETVDVSEGFESGNFVIRSTRTVAWLSALTLAGELGRSRGRRTAGQNGWQDREKGSQGEDCLRDAASEASQGTGCCSGDRR